MSKVLALVIKHRLWEMCVTIIIYYLLVKLIKFFVSFFLISFYILLQLPVMHE